MSCLNDQLGYDVMIYTAFTTPKAGAWWAMAVVAVGGVLGVLARPGSL